jgi:hypothetical protein
LVWNKKHFLGAIFNPASLIRPNKHVIAYYSKSLSKQQRQYCVTRRELLAIVQAVRHFHHYLERTAPVPVPLASVSKINSFIDMGILKLDLKSKHVLIY